MTAIQILRRVALSACLFALLFAGPVHAADYPSRPIMLIVPWAAGGGTDTLSRTYAVYLEEELGGQINVVNRSGGSGVIGHAAIASAQPDGYTLGVATIDIMTLRSRGLSELTPADFTPIAYLASTQATITVAENAPYETAEDVLEAIRSNPPGTFTASGTGQGGAWHLDLAGWLLEAGLEPDRVRWVPSRGGAPAIQDLVAGGIDFFLGSLTEAQSMLEAGKVRSLAVMYPERISIFPDVPTIEEATGISWHMGSPYYLVGPKGIPDDIVAEVAAAAQAAFEHPEFQKFLEQRGFAPSWMGPEEVTSYFEEQTPKLDNLIGELGLGPEAAE